MLCRYAECCVSLNDMLNVIMLNVIIIGTIFKVTSMMN